MEKTPEKSDKKPTPPKKEAVKRSEHVAPSSRHGSSDGYIVNSKK